MLPFAAPGMGAARMGCASTPSLPDAEIFHSGRGGLASEVSLTLFVVELGWACQRRVLN